MAVATAAATAGAPLDSVRLGTGVGGQYGSERMGAGVLSAYHDAVDGAWPR